MRGAHQLDRLLRLSSLTDGRLTSQLDREAETAAPRWAAATPWSRSRRCPPPPWRAAPPRRARSQSTTRSRPRTAPPGWCRRPAPPSSARQAQIHLEVSVRAAPVPVRAPAGDVPFGGVDGFGHRVAPPLCAWFGALACAGSLSLRRRRSQRAAIASSSPPAWSTCRVVWSMPKRSRSIASISRRAAWQSASAHTSTCAESAGKPR